VLLVALVVSEAFDPGGLLERLVATVGAAAIAACAVHILRLPQHASATTVAPPMAETTM
jgi:hypothetical protein